MTKPDSSRPFDFAGDIHQGKLPPDLDTAYRGAFWTARCADTILDHCRPSGPSYHTRALIRESGKARILDLHSPLVATYPDAPAALILLLDEWLRPIAYDVRQVADEIALARGTRKPIRLGGQTAATCHELALQRAEFVRATLYRTLGKAAKLPSVCTVETPPYRELFFQHWQIIAPALADTPPLGTKFFAVLKLEALRAEERRRKHSPPVAVSQGNAPPLDIAKPVSDKKSAQLTPEERENAVREYLRDYPHATIKAVATAIGASTGAVNGTAAWQAVMRQRKANRPQRKPRERQLINPEQSSLLADNHNPVDAVIDAEQTKEIRWRRLIESTDAEQRAVLNGLNEKEREALLEYAEGHDERKLKEMIATIVAGKLDEASERRGRRRCSNGERS